MFRAVGSTVAGAALALICADATAVGRSRPARAEFVRAVPCPATGKTRRPCPGFVVDHVTPICAGGDDTPANMQWQTVADAKLKDRYEMRLCREIRSRRAAVTK